MEDRYDIVVVGGGLAGLAAAALAGREGRRVLLLERSSTLGGRAQTFEQEGFYFNEGAHAFSRGGPAQEVLDSLGVKYEGAEPLFGGFRVVKDGRLHRFPLRATSLLFSDLFSTRDKVEVARAFTRFKQMRPADYDSVPFSDFLTTEVRSPAVRHYVRAVTRFATYSGADDGFSAGAAVRALSGSGKVLYLDYGWHTLVAGARNRNGQAPAEGLRAKAEAAGVEIETGARAAAVLIENGQVSGVAVDGAGIARATAVVLAVEPQRAAALLAESGLSEPRRWAEQAVPQRVAALDLGLRRLPVKDLPLALSLDQAMYCSVQSSVAKLAPEGQAAVALIKYLRPGESGTAQAQAELEAYMDLLQPGWREFEVARQYMPAATVHAWLPRADQGGLAAHPGPVVHGVQGLYLAGEWTSREHTLANAAFDSARQAASLAAAYSMRTSMALARGAA